MLLNIVFVDEKYIGWQVIGCYLNCKEGCGLLFFFGWDGCYDWDGYVDLIFYLFDQDLQQGWLGIVNYCIVQFGYGVQLFNFWYYLECVECIVQFVGVSKSYDIQSMICMQYDQILLFVVKL